MPFVTAHNTHLRVRAYLTGARFGRVGKYAHNYSPGLPYVQYTRRYTNLRVAFQHATPTAMSRIFGNSDIPILSRSRSILLLTFPRERFIHFHSRANPTGTRGNSPMLALELIADAATTLHLATVATWRFVRITYNGNSLIKLNARQSLTVAHPAIPLAAC